MNFDRGTMREKMAIFKARNCLSSDTKIFKGCDVDEIDILLRENWSHISSYKWKSIDENHEI